MAQVNSGYTSEEGRGGQLESYEDGRERRERTVGLGRVGVG